jgi:hypothetical protein
MASHNNLDPKWEELTPIFDKWMPVAELPAVMEQCERLGKSTTEFLLGLTYWNTSKRTFAIDPRTSEQRGEELGSAIGTTMRASFMLGLEYAAHDPLAARARDKLPSHVKHQLRTAMGPATEFAIYLVALLRKHEVTSPDDSRALTEQAAQVILNDSIQCFIAGLGYITSP